jgi:hypothetical protein
VLEPRGAADSRKPTGGKTLSQMGQYQLAIKERRKDYKPIMASMNSLRKLAINEVKHE